ncbi:family 43 glycosylhydrolase [Spongiivirga citrea]|uniref:Family 43 glycosylhydrolase n=1 Tax=Spongiivirga citrea TaxID=1481457 RepID=A0A6M0CQN0_9FLAO|nr:family 43 glycosylhydrolase [Spongiivirga citrea]NER17817.1 family 43 glycosylhydrolase [Spongiivirga citrea]
MKQFLALYPNSSFNQRWFVFVIPLFLAFQVVNSQNPIVPNQGLNDPHIHIFNDTAYVYASHDKSPNNTKFIMEDWWVWSSPDLVNWSLKSVLKPEDTYIGKPFADCWATDVGFKNGKYYWYFSERNRQTGVVVGNSPTGPWKDPLGKPLLSSELTPTHEYDMSIYEENDEHYIIFGVWDYYIARLNEDMISLAEEPKRIVITNPRGPYNQDGKNKEKPTDDKPSLHKYKGKYYLSWGCFYAMSDSLYGPYNYVDTVIKETSFAPGYEKPTWPNGFLQGRHGNFFTWNNQWYFTYCDISQTGNRYFRDAFISYVHYKENGEIAPIRIDGIGVGRYEAHQGKIEAEDYFKASAIVKKEINENQFVVRTDGAIGNLCFPNIEGLEKAKKIRFSFINKEKGLFKIEVRTGNKNAKPIAIKQFSIENDDNGKKQLSMSLPKMNSKEDIYFSLTPLGTGALYLDYFVFEY